MFTQRSARPVCPLQVPHLFPGISPPQDRNPMTDQQLITSPIIGVSIIYPPPPSPTKLVTPTGSFAEHPPVSALLSAATTRPRHGEESRSRSSISHVVRTRERNNSV